MLDLLSFMENKKYTPIFKLITSLNADGTSIGDTLSYEYYKTKEYKNIKLELSETVLKFIKKIIKDYSFKKLTLEFQPNQTLTIFEEDPKMFGTNQIIKRAIGIIAHESFHRIIIDDYYSYVSAGKASDVLPFVLLNKEHNENENEEKICVQQKGAKYTIKLLDKGKIVVQNNNNTVPAFHPKKKIWLYLPQHFCNMDPYFMVPTKDVIDTKDNSKIFYEPQNDNIILLSYMENYISYLIAKNIHTDSFTKGTIERFIKIDQTGLSPTDYMELLKEKGGFRNED